MKDLHPLWLVIAAVLISALPLVVGVVTSYLKLSIVLGVLRSGFGAQQLPGAIVSMVLSLSLTLIVMGPTLDATYARVKGLDLAMVYRTPTMGAISAISGVFDPWRDFLSAHAGSREVRLLQEIEAPPPAAAEAASHKVEPAPANAPLPGRVLVAAFVISELKQAFQMSFILLLPFLIIDLVVANLLAALGMFMLNPVLISLPLKLILFVMADGWLLLTKALVLSYRS